MMGYEARNMRGIVVGKLIIKKHKLGKLRRIWKVILKWILEKISGFNPYPANVEKMVSS
jgi:hypothetical protein